MNGTSRDISPITDVVGRVLNGLDVNHPLLVRRGTRLLYSFSRIADERLWKTSAGPAEFKCAGHGQEKTSSNDIPLHEQNSHKDLCRSSSAPNSIGSLEMEGCGEASKSTRYKEKLAWDIQYDERQRDRKTKKNPFADSSRTKPDFSSHLPGCELSNRRMKWNNLLRDVSGSGSIFKSGKHISQRTSQVQKLKKAISCDFHGCKSVMSSNRNIKHHQASVHGKKLYMCDFPGCE